MSADSPPESQSWDGDNFFARPIVKESAFETATQSVERPPEKKRRVEDNPNDASKQHIADPDVDRKIQAVVVPPRPLADASVPSLFFGSTHITDGPAYKGNSALNSRVADEFGPKAFGEETKQPVDQNHHMAAAVASAATTSYVAVAPMTPTTHPNPQPQQLQHMQTFVSLGSSDQGPFNNQLAAYQAGLMGIHPHFLQKQLVPNAFFPPFAGMAAATAINSSFQLPMGLPQNMMMEAAGMTSAQPPLSAQDTAKLSGKRFQSLYMSCDDDSLSEYQCLVRKQIELFEARPEDVASNAKGRNKPIVIGQVGIRCKHCSLLPPKSRQRGATYYPAKLNGLYQAAQSMASGHLCSHCGHIPQSVRQELIVLRERKSSAGGGKKYWGDGVRVLGVYEDEHGLRFRKADK
ncbi:hypothetical protein IV203_004230 [Nitzschia inconspicua]|uniref:Uncharacterized protein n=1 Tax=Nitzschia inconspicua TaxID=303405 RepID=A0A9K3L3C7_9STRA|nr:hypothetical protein IV203_004230 [Nitzschia inconspicua]